MVGLIVKGAASQTSNLQEWHNSNGTVLGSINPSGNLTISSSATNNTTVATLKDANNNSLTFGSDGSDRAFITVKSNPSASSLAGAYFTAVGYEESWFNVRTNSNTSNLKYMRFGNLANRFSIQRLNDAENTILATPFSFANDATNNAFYMNSSGNVVLNGTSALGHLTIYSPSASTVGQVIRATASQTANLQEWQHNDGTVFANINRDGIAFFGRSTYSFTTFFGSSYFAGGGMVNIVPLNSSIIGAIIRAQSSQTANLQEWQDSTGTILSRVDASRRIGINSTATNAMLEIQGTGSTDSIRVKNSSGGLTLWGGNSRLYMNTQLQITGGSWVDGILAVDTFGASNKGIVVRGSASQTANLQEWQDSTGTTQAFVRYDGFINTNNSLRVAGDNISAYRFQGVSDGNYTMNFPGSGNIQLFSAVDSVGGGSRVLGITNATTVPSSNPTNGGIVYVESGALKYRGSGGAITTIARSGNESSTISVNTATTLDTVALSGFTTLEYTISIKIGRAHV